MKYTTVFVQLRNPRGKLEAGQIVVRDGFALATFSDPKLAKQLYEADKNNEDVSYNEKHNAYVQKFKGMKKEEIIKHLRKELEKSGGKILEK